MGSMKTKGEKLIWIFHFSTPQSRCLLDHGSSAGQLDHGAEGALPGERFNADQQCKCPLLL